MEHAALQALHSSPAALCCSHSLQARLPVVALMGVSLLGERLLVDRLHMWLEVDGRDQVGSGLSSIRCVPG